MEAKVLIKVPPQLLTCLKVTLHLSSYISNETKYRLEVSYGFDLRNC